VISAPAIAESNDISIEKMVIKRDLLSVPKGVRHICVVRAHLSGPDKWELDTVDLADLDHRVLTNAPSCLDHEAHPDRMVIIYFGKVDRAVLNDRFGYKGSSPFREKAIKYFNAGYALFASALTKCDSPINISVLGQRHQQLEIIDTIPLDYWLCVTISK
jgi:hypothetical protein